jgi:phospholipid transport system substrate-binding protein
VTGRAWVGMALLLAVVPRASAEGAAPAQVVDRLHAALLGVLKDSATLTYDERFARLVPVLRETYDLDFMAEKAVGRRWSTLSDADRQRWSALFARFTTANYAGRFVGYTGQKFETLGEEPAAADTTIVRTRLVNPSDKDVELNYRLRQTPAGWRIIDVYLDGTVSELALRRTEYATVLKRDGFDKLVALLDGKIADLAAAKGER